MPLLTGTRLPPAPEARPSPAVRARFPTLLWRGGYVPREYRARNYYVTDYRAHHLSAPPRGQQWVQIGPDYVLMAIATGLIAHMMLSQ